MAHKKQEADIYQDTLFDFEAMVAEIAKTKTKNESVDAQAAALLTIAVAINVASEEIWSKLESVEKTLKSITKEYQLESEF